MENVTRNSWKFNPMIKSISLKYKCILSSTEWKLLKLGLKPKEMEDKWFVFLEESTMYFSRSWTGNCIFTVEIKKLSNETVLLCHAKVVNDENIYRNEKSKNVLKDLISMIIKHNDRN